MVKVRKGTKNHCPKCFEREVHNPGCIEAKRQLLSKMRPANFFELSGKEQWEIDKKLGILDYEGY